MILNKLDLPPGLVGTLKDLLVDEDVTIRRKATECLFVMAGKTVVIKTITYYLV